MTQGHLNVFAYRVMPVVVALSLLTVLVSGDPIGQTFVWLPDGATTGVWCLYTLLLFAIAVRPRLWMHQTGAYLAVCVFASRGIAFGEIAVTQSRWDLMGGIAERVLLLLFAVIWHLRGVQRHVLKGG